MGRCNCRQWEYAIDASQRAARRDDLVEAIVAALERRGMIPSGKWSLGMESDRCDR